MKKYSKLFIISGILLITLALIMIINNQLEDINAGKQSSEVIKDLEKIISESDNTKTKEEKEEIKVNGYNYLGTISIPTLDLYLPIMDKYDYNRLKIAPCLYYGSIKTNNLVICAHNYKRHFGNIDKLEPKDLIIITDLNGNKHYYEVVEVEILSATSIDEMLNSNFNLTLFSCTKGGKSRVTVRCNEIKN